MSQSTIVETTVTCASCKTPKPTSEFPPSELTNRPHPRCVVCVRAIDARYRANRTPERVAADRKIRAERERARQAVKMAEDPDWRRRTNLLNFYGITLEQYNEMLAEQGGHCATCPITPEENGKSLCVDHDHACCPGNRTCGKCNRGLLCNWCNSLLGHAKDDVDRLMATAAYLVQWGG